MSPVSDIAAATAHHKEECFSHLSPLHEGNHSAFLSKFTPIRDSHEIFLMEVLIDDLLITDVLTTLTDGSLSPELDSGDDPSWADALASPDHEYWIAGAHEELKSLEDLQVFVLVPRSTVPPGHCPLKGKLVCK
jgi:hypothetical protein